MQLAYLWGGVYFRLLPFGFFLFVTRFKFMPALWLFPLFLFCLSPIIHYEHRYSQPFFLFCDSDHCHVFAQILSNKK